MIKTLCQLAKKNCEKEERKKKKKLLIQDCIYHNFYHYCYKDKTQTHYSFPSPSFVSKRAYLICHLLQSQPPP